MSKLNIKDAYYSIPIYEPNQKYLKFQFDRFLYKYALPNGYRGQRKFTKLLKPPLPELRRVEKIVFAGYFDDLINMNSSYTSCLRIVVKMIKLFIALGFVIHPIKATVHTYSKNLISRFCDWLNKHIGLFI